MKLKNVEKWKKAVENNEDSYCKGIVTFAERWADLMEKQIAQGRTVADCAKATSHKADTEGITGYMYGYAVLVLSQVWEHGEELRRWHNLSTQLGHEGEEANETGDVLNPGLLVVVAK